MFTKSSTLNQQIVKSCKGCNQGDVLFTESRAGLPPEIGCSHCSASYGHLRQEIGWIDAKFREYEEAQSEIAVKLLCDTLRQMTYVEREDLYAEGWFGDPQNVIIRLRRPVDSGSILETCHDLTTATSRAFGGGR